MDIFDLSCGLLHFFVFAGVGLLLLRLTHTHRETLEFQKRLFLWAIGVRFLMSIVIYEGGLINALKDEDGGAWVIGVGLWKGWEDRGYSAMDAPLLFLEAYSASQRGHYYLVGSLFMITGLAARLAVAALNCLAGALTVVFVYRLARSLFSEVVARRAAWLACFIPSLIIWSAQTLKEPVVIFLETLALYGCIQLRVSGFTPRHILLTGLAIILIYPFRFYAAYLALGTVVIALVLPRSGTGRSSIGSALAVVALLVSLVAISGAQVTKELEQQRFDLQSIETFKEWSAIGQGSGVKIEADLHTPTGMGFAILVGGLHLLLAPFPWQWGGSARMALVIPEVVIWWGILLYGVVPGLRHCLRHRFFDVLPLLLFITGMGLLYSLLFGNIGLIYRQRAQLLPWLLIFGAVGMELRQLARSAEAVREDVAEPASVG